MSSSPSPVQIREANAHLVALHRRLAELEELLQEAEKTVREQAESLIRKDEQLRAATQEITDNKDREISLLNEKLCGCEETIQRYQHSLKEKESVITQLHHRCHLLDRICKSRPSLDSLLALMAEAERLGPPGGGFTFNKEFSNSWGGSGGGGGGGGGSVGGLGETWGGSGGGGGGGGEASMVNSSLTDSPSKVSSNHKDFSLSEDDVDSQDMDDVGFGTTV